MEQEKALAPPVRIVDDGPAVDDLVFGFGVYADTLAGLIANKENTTPLVVGVHGTWGAGKTSLMKAIKARLDGETLTDPQRYRRCKTVWLQAWQYDREEEILAAFIEAIFKAMAADGFFSLARAKIDTVTRRIDKSQIFTSIKKLVGGADISEFFTELPFKEKLGAYDTFQKFFVDLIWTFLNWRFKLSGQEKPDDKKCAFVIFVDDLDRCPQDRIVKVLDTVKRFLHRSGCIFVVGAIAENIEQAMVNAYGPGNARHLLEKIFQVRFRLPQLRTEEFAALLEGKQSNDARTLEQYLPVMLPAVGYNPRQLKCFINQLNLLNGLLQGAGLAIGFDAVLHWHMIDRLFPDLAAAIMDNPENLYTLQKHLDQLADTAEGIPACAFTDEQLDAQDVPAELRPYLQRPRLVESVARLRIAPEQLSALLDLSVAVKTG